MATTHQAPAGSLMLGPRIQGPEEHVAELEELGSRNLRVWLLAQVDRTDDVGVIARWVTTDPTAAAWPAAGSSIRIDELVGLVEAAGRRNSDAALPAALVVALDEWSRLVRGLD